MNRVFFVVQFRRSRQQLISLENFENHEEALENLCDTERVNENPDIEVVLLSADSKESLSRTHSRYFSAAGQHDFATAI